MVPTPDPLDIREAARSFLAVAFSVLRELRVIPPPTFHPYLRVGHDYYGPDLTFRGEFERLESSLSVSYPERFQRPLGDRSLDFPSSYIFSLLEACVARLTLSDEPFIPTSPTVDASIDELLQVLGASEREVACCRLVSHLTTVDEEPVQIERITIVPIGNRRDMYQELASVIPGVSGAFGRDPPFAYDPPQSILVARGRDADVFALADALSSDIDRFLLLIRLIFASTTQSFFEIKGETQLVRRLDPTMSVFRSGSRNLVRRTTRLSETDAEPITALGGLLVGLGVDRTAMVVTSFDMAVLKFMSSYLGEPWYEQIVDLATALEAILSGRDKEDVALRLRTRAAALLAGPNDSARAVFDDVGRLYGLRSTLVHGGNLKLKDAQKAIRGLSTAKPGFMPGEELALGVDRLRDLVRRGILARIALAAAPEPIWPLQGETPVDAILADGTERQRWHDAWRERLASLGAAKAPEHATPAISSLRKDPAWDS